MPVLERKPVELRGFEPNFDRRDYSKKDVDKVKLNVYTFRQVETLLGERLNVLLSKTIYEIKDAVIYGENMDKPFMEVMIRGRDYMAGIVVEDRIDKKREQAEIDGFSFIQEIFCNANTPINTMIISVSPPGKDGSLYRHNFYDIFTLKDLKEEKGQRYIEARRYSSALLVEEYRKRLSQLYPKIYGEDIKLTDAYFLSHPVVASSFFQDADSLHKHLHSNHEYLEDKDFKEVIRACAPLILSYIDALSKDPEDIDKHNLILNAILNKADIQANYLKRYRKKVYDIFVRPYALLSTDQEINFLGRKPVRTASTGCPGGSGGFGTSIDNAISVLGSPFSIADFGNLNDESYSFDHPGPCRKCGRDINCGPCKICEDCDRAIQVSSNY